MCDMEFLFLFFSTGMNFALLYLVLGNIVFSNYFTGFSRENWPSWSWWCCWPSGTSFYFIAHFVRATFNGYISAKAVALLHWKEHIDGYFNFCNAFCVTVVYLGVLSNPQWFHNICKCWGYLFTSFFACFLHVVVKLVVYRSQEGRVLYHEIV